MATATDICIAADTATITVGTGGGAIIMAGTVTIATTERASLPKPLSPIHCPGESDVQ